MPLVSLVVFTWLGLVYSFRKIRNLKRQTVIEANEALDILTREFSNLGEVLRKHETDLANSKL